MAEKLQRSLSPTTILLITINSIMGTGVFFLPALGAKLAGNMSIISWFLMALMAMGVSLIFAELVGMFPFAGGVYEYSKQAFGHFPSFIIGWMTMIAGNITIAMLVVGAIRYLNPGLPTILKIAISIGIILVFNLMAYKGMKTSGVMLVTFSIITISTVLSLTIPGFFSFKIGNFQPFFTHSFSITLLTIFFIAETFFGWETATFLAEETKNAKKVMPRAMWLGTLLISIMVLLFVITSLGNIPWQVFGQSLTPLTDLANIYYGLGSSTIFSIMVYLSIIGSVAAWIVSAPRLLMSLAKDRLFLPQLAELHPKYKTPHKAIIFQTLLTSILVIIGAGSYEMLLHLLLPIVLLLYSAVILSFIVLRYTKKDYERPFKVKFGVPLATSLIVLMISLIVAWAVMDATAIHTLLLALKFLIIGLPLFFLLNIYYNPEAIIVTTELFASLSLWLENFTLPKRVRKEILYLFKNLEEKHILDYGSGVGTMTLLLAEKTGPKGKVTSTDISKKNLKILQKRLYKKGYEHVTLLHDPHQVNRVHPSIKEVDVVISVGMLSYIQDLEKVLKDMRFALKKSGKICFVEYVDYFKILPNPQWLRNEKVLKRIFHKQGFGVQVVKIHGLFWNYLFIYGDKIDSEMKDAPYI